MLIASERIKQKIKQHAERDYPDECGGMVIGRFLNSGDKEIVDIYPLVNAREDSRHNRVLLLPEDVLKAEKHAREMRLDVIGYYHSHPNAPAIPSQYDLDHALPVWSYVIVSVVEGEAVDIRSWEMEENRAKFNEEKLESFEEQSIWQSR